MLLSVQCSGLRSTVPRLSLCATVCTFTIGIASRWLKLLMKSYSWLAELVIYIKGSTWKTDRQTDRQRQTQRETETETQRERQRDTHTHSHAHSHAHTHTHESHKKAVLTCVHFMQRLQLFLGQSVPEHHTGFAWDGHRPTVWWQCDEVGAFQADRSGEQQLGVLPLTVTNWNRPTRYKNLEQNDC